MLYLKWFPTPPGGGVTSSLLVFKIALNSEFGGIPADQITIKIELRIDIGDWAILGVSRLLSPEDNSPVWQRTNDSLALGLNAKSYQHTSVVACQTELANETTTDDFAMRIHGGTLPFYKDIDIVNMRVSDGAVVAKLSDPNSGFVWTGTRKNSQGADEAVDVMTYYPGHYIKRWQDTAQEVGGEANRREHIQLSMWKFDGAMYVEPYYRGTFEAVTGSYDGKTILRSYAGGMPYTNKTIGDFRTYAGNNGMSLGDWRDFDFLCLYLIKYANYDSQAMVGGGIVSDFSSAQKTGYSSLGSTIYAHDTLQGRDGQIGTDQKTSVWCLGLCNPWGNVSEFVDGITINNHQAYIATDPSCYSAGADIAEGNYSAKGYAKLGYTNWKSDGYPRRLGCDSNNQLISFPDTNNSGTGDSSTGICDYYYKNTGVRLVLRGGAYAIPATRAGAFSLDCGPGFTYTVDYVGCRLLKTA